MHEYSITHLSKEFGVTSRAIRHYEDKGLLKPSRSGQQRIYSQADRVHLELILRGKKIGLSLTEIKEILDLYHLPEGEKVQQQFLFDKIKQRRIQLSEQKTLIDEMLNELDAITHRFSN